VLQCVAIMLFKHSGPTGSVSLSMPTGSVSLSMLTGSVSLSPLVCCTVLQKYSITASIAVVCKVSARVLQCVAVCCDVL